MFVCLSFSNDEEQHLFMCLFTTDISFLERKSCITTLKAVGPWENETDKCGRLKSHAIGMGSFVKGGLRSSSRVTTAITIRLK